MRISTFSILRNVKKQLINAFCLPKAGGVGHVPAVLFREQKFMFDFKVV